MNKQQQIEQIVWRIDFDDSFSRVNFIHQQSIISFEMAQMIKH